VSDAIAPLWLELSDWVGGRTVWVSFDRLTAMRRVVESFGEGSREYTLLLGPRDVVMVAETPDEILLRAQGAQPNIRFRHRRYPPAPAADV